jgi:CRISPR-associated protein Cmr5
MAKGPRQTQQNFAKDRRQKAKEKRSTSEEKTVATATQAVSAGPELKQSLASPTVGRGAQTLQQERAKYALDKVKAALEAGVNGKEFKSYAASFPAMVQMNGLGQAAAFYFSQGVTYRTLYDILSNWMIQKGQPYADEEDLLTGITGQDMHRYRIAQADALLLLDWVKRFAKAFVRED